MNLVEATVNIVILILFIIQLEYREDKFHPSGMFILCIEGNFFFHSLFSSSWFCSQLFLVFPMNSHYHSLFSHSVVSSSFQLHGLQHARSINNSWSLLKLMSIESVKPSNHLILCRRLLLPPSIFPSIRVFSNESVLCVRQSKYWHFSISPSNEYSGLISFRMDWLDLLAVQGTFKSLQHHNSKASILWCSAFFLVQLSHPYMTTGKTIALTRLTCVGKVISLLFNMLSRLVITFLPRSKRLLISWLQLPSAVILEPPKIKSNTVSIVSPSICHEVIDGTRCHDLSFLNVEL